ncbi:MAG: dihydrolipoyllysine-residue acetyltransferase [Aestuariibacter sp.]
MTTEFILPDIGEGIVECELMEWLVAEGDEIVEDQPVAEVMTDKAVVQIPAMHSGIVEKLHYQKGDIAKVHAPLFAMTVAGAAASKEAATPAPSVAQNESANDNVTDTSGNIIDFILPDIGEGIVECELVEWLVQEGDKVEEDQPVADVMTDKALVQIPAKNSGTIAKLYYQKGEIAKVHAPLYAIDIGGSAAAVASGSKPTASEQTSQSGQAQVSEPSDNKPVRQGKALASPAVRRLAREKNIDIAKVPGSGKKGRVMKEDIHAFVNKGPTATQTQVTPAAKQPVEGGIRVEPLKGIKAAMAKQMTDAVFTIPHFSVSEEIEMDALISLRKQMKAEFEAQNVKLSFLPIMMKALSQALLEFPIVNARVNEDCTEIHYHEDHNIGLAVDSKIGLLVPNIKQVQHKSIFEIAQELQEIIEQAREGRLSQDKLKGGTISISNIGVLGGTTATPVINKPESAIVALGKIQKLPRFDENDNVQAVNIMHVSWSGDHRIIDGATMVRFNNRWKSYLENPVTLLSKLK